MHAPVTNAGGARTPAIINPVVDFLSVGGLSLLVFVPLLLSGRTDLLMIGAGAQALVATAINMPHFMASYRLVYGSRAVMVRHKWASFGVPAILTGCLVAALWEPQLVGTLLVTTASVYLAWHYTAQVWGMMASHAFLAGLRFADGERRLVKAGLYLLIVWHVTWFLTTQLRDPSRVAPLYRVVTAAMAVAFALGSAGLWRLRRRTGRPPTLLMVTPWLAIFAWYAVMARDPKAIFWVQIAHAIQYLAFPVRVELNRSAATAPGQVARRMAVYAVGLLGASWLAAQVVPVALMGAIGKAFGEAPANAAPILVLMFINIHHFFTDGVIWKLRNPEVTKALFAHVPPPPGGMR